MYENELSLIEADFILLERQKEEAKKIKDKRLRIFLLYKIGILKIILKLLKRIIQKSAGNKDIGKLFFDIAHVTEQYIYWNQEQEIFAVEHNEWRRQSLENIEGFELSTIKEIESWLETLEKRIKDKEAKRRILEMLYKWEELLDINKREAKSLKSNSF